MRRLLAGETGPVRDAVLLNAGAALAVHAAADGDVLRELRDGVDRAQAAIDGGAAADLLSRWRSVTASLA